MKKIIWRPFISELIGTALLIAIGVSFVILDFGSGSPVAGWIPNPGARRLLTGFLFGSTGALIAISPIGKESGAHINPVVTLAFWVKKKITWLHASGYILAQLIGAILGSLPLLAWGTSGRSIDYGATLPGPGYGVWWATLGELGTTFMLIIGLFIFLGHPRLRQFTPLLFPFLYAIMVYLEAPVSGTSTNPARSLGPALIAGNWTGWWIYWIGPLAGTLVALLALNHRWLAKFEVEVAKLYHFEHDPHEIFREVSK
jgi:aquaporin Z